MVSINDFCEKIFLPHKFRFVITAYFLATSLNELMIVQNENRRSVSGHFIIVAGFMSASFELSRIRVCYRLFKGSTDKNFATRVLNMVVRRSSERSRIQGLLPLRVFVYPAVGSPDQVERLSFHTVFFNLNRTRLKHTYGNEFITI